MYGCSEEEVSTLASLRKCPVSTITLCYILLTSILFTIPFPQRSLLVRPTVWTDLLVVFCNPLYTAKKKMPDDSQAILPSEQKIEMEQ